jgi:hypothetical protein
MFTAILSEFQNVYQWHKSNGDVMSRSSRNYCDNKNFIATFDKKKLFKESEI